MRLHPALILALSLGACEAPAAADAAVEPAPAAVASAPVAPQPGPLVQPAEALEQACRGLVSEQFGQTGAAVRFEAGGTDRATVSWAAPVDGGVLSFECRMGEDGADLLRDGRSVTVNVPPVARATEQEAR